MPLSPATPRSRLYEIGAWLVAALALARLTTRLPAAARGFDFNHYFAASRLWWEGLNPYRHELAPVCERFGLAAPELITHASNTPALVAALAPLTVLPPAAAFAVWTLLQVAGFAVALWWAREQLPARAWRLWALLAVASTPVLLHLTAGQTQMLLAGLLAGAHRLHRRGHALPACLLVTVAGLWKLFPLVLLPWFIGRAGRPRLRLLLACGLLAGAVVAVTGPQRWADFARQGLAVVNRCALEKSRQLDARNHTLVSWTMDVAALTFDFAPPPLTRPVALLTGAVALLVGYRWALRGRRDEAAQFGLLVAMMLAAVPVVWSHYYVLMVFPLAVLVARVRERPTPGRVTGLAVLGWLFVDPGIQVQGMWGSRQHWGGVLTTYVMLYGVLAVAAWLAREKPA